MTSSPKADDYGGWLYRPSFLWLSSLRYRMRLVKRRSCISWRGEKIEPLHITPLVPETTGQSDETDELDSFGPFSFVVQFDPIVDLNSYQVGLSSAKLCILVNGMSQLFYWYKICDQLNTSLPPGLQDKHPWGILHVPPPSACPSPSTQDSMPAFSSIWPYSKPNMVYLQDRGNSVGCFSENGHGIGLHHSPTWLALSHYENLRNVSIFPVF